MVLPTNEQIRAADKDDEFRITIKLDIDDMIVLRRIANAIEDIAARTVGS